MRQNSIFFTVLSLISLSFFVSCKNKKTDNELRYDTVVAEDSIFRNTLYIQEGPYRKNKPIHMYSTLEYIGAQDSIIIYHGLPYFHHIIVNDQGVSFIDDFWTTIAAFTWIRKGEIITIPFEKIKVWSETDADADYWRKFAFDPELKLPKGNYTITGRCNFSLQERADGSYSNNTQIRIEVK